MRGLFEGHRPPRQPLRDKLMCKRKREMLERMEAEGEVEAG